MPVAWKSLDPAENQRRQRAKQTERSGFTYSVGNTFHHTGNMRPSIMPWNQRTENNSNDTKAVTSVAMRSKSLPWVVVKLMGNNTKTFHTMASLQASE